MLSRCSTRRRATEGGEISRLRDGNPEDMDAAFHAGRLDDDLRLNVPPQNPLLVASATDGGRVIQRG
jgi:hypothetical protein